MEVVFGDGCVEASWLDGSGGVVVVVFVGGGGA